MAQGDNAANHRANLAYTSTLPSDFNQTLRLSLTKSLTQYYAPLDEIPPQIQDLLARLDKKELSSAALGGAAPAHHTSLSVGGEFQIINIAKSGLRGDLSARRAAEISQLRTACRR